jgi:hypothetical protein
MSKPATVHLLPAPRSLVRRPGVYHLPAGRPAAIRLQRTSSAPPHPEGYALTIDRSGVTVEYREPVGLRAATATWRQLQRAHGHRLPCLQIRDWPDFVRRGVMLDISRGRVPRLQTLLDLVEKLAGFKINELQLYTEHTFAYRQYPSVWRGWGALTAREIRRLDARCRELGIDLVPNQNSFGHLRYFLADPRLKSLGELSGPYEAETRDFLRRPTTLAPDHPGSLRFLRGLYDELLPNFSSRFFNVGCDETWDLGKGRSQARCDREGKGRVYLEFLKKIQREVSARGRTMMFWGDIILKHPQLIGELARLRTAANASGAPGIIALSWGYEADHPFAEEAAQFARANIPFYVCPGTSTWQTLLGRHDNALANLRAAAAAGRKFGAAGFLNTDWGDGGHPQPLAVSWPMLVAGAALAWNSSALDETVLADVLNRDVYEDPAGNTAGAALALGLAHQKLQVTAANETPLGTVIAAPPPEARELFCRHGLQWFAKIRRQNIRRARREIQKQRRVLGQGKARSKTGRILAAELDLAARMAEQSCQFMSWQQAVAAKKILAAKSIARQGIRDLRRLEKDFNAYWPARNKGTPKHCAAFLQWRIDDLSQYLRKIPSPQ